MPYSAEEKTEYMRKYMRLRRARNSGQIAKYEFLKELRQVVFERCGNKCSICHLDLREILTIHHLNGNHEENGLDNLQLLCYNCHMMVERHPDKLEKIRNWDEKPTADIIRKIYDAFEKSPSPRTGFCVFHEDRPSVVIVRCDENGLTIEEGKSFGACEECWNVIADK